MNPLNIPKLCGGDIELGNFITGVESREGTGSKAALLLLDKIRGVAARSRDTQSSCDCEECRARRVGPPQQVSFGHGSLTYYPAYSGYSGYGGNNPQDWKRTFLPGNGGCAYIDLDHLEVCLPEVLSARDHVGAWNAMLRIAAKAQAEVNADLPEGRKLHVLANNTDGLGNSYGSHLDFLITRRAWENIFNRRLHYMLSLAAYQASSIVFTGQGKVGSERTATPCDYQISQRADFIEVLTGTQTTYNRPLVNSRDEALCGTDTDPNSPARTMARLHVIFYDSNLCHVAGMLKVGVLQILLAMIEAEQINPQLMLNDPVEAVGVWSRDPELTARATLASGKEVTAVELQLLFLEEAKAFADAGGCDGIVPKAGTILDLWADTLLKLKARNYPALARRLDWVLKLSLLERVLEQRPQLDWSSPEIKHLDHQYSALDGGLYFACERQGAVERVASDAEIQRFVDEPPEDTRAWARSRLLRLAEPDQIEQVDWDEVCFRLGSGWGGRHTVPLTNPLGFTKDKVRFLETASLDNALDNLGVRPAVESRPIITTPAPLPARRISPQQPRPPRP